MGQCCFARWCLSGSVTLPVGGTAGRMAGQHASCRSRKRSGDGHFTAGQYGYVPLGQHLVTVVLVSI